MDLELAIVLGARSEVTELFQNLIGFEMDTFLNGQLDAASAMVYNEYPVVLEAGVKPEDINIISYNAEGVGMLEDQPR